MHLLMVLSLAASVSLAQSSLPRDAPTLRVHIDSDAPEVELFRVTQEGVGTVSTVNGVGTVGIIQYQRECRAPCGVSILEPKADFFIGGDGVTPSRRFSLVGQGEEVTLQVDPGSTAMRWLGWTSLTLGVTSLVMGGLSMLIGASDSSGNSLNPEGSDPFKTLGWVGLVGGGVLTGASIPLLAFSSTDVEILPSNAPARSHVVTLR
jgi:hypothetical protein